ncbi:hypothetical protein LUZ61_004980 [Rhynchospora tenuis]|uniref:Ankyrin n=1 Tax=Rhynchospora tenuis TaxID=198213 RepID=A0AAD6EUB2_9POAL|nr:hypothetical protein LUZ61_004980 [Rhynchospora tenuis]
MDSSTSISSHTNEITEDTGASSSFTNGALLEGRPLEVAISEIKTSSLLNLKEPPSGAEDEQNDNKLLKAAVSGNFSEIEQMVLQYPQILLKPTPQGSTCLHISSIFGKEKFCKDVLAQNQSLLTSLNNYRETPLIVAVKSGHVNLATTFLQMYKEQGLNEKTLISDINGDTALHHAIRQGHRELALKLIEAEPHLSRKVNKYNESPLYIAVMRGFNDVFKGLWGTDRCSHKGPYDDNALHAAVRNDNIG